ncbi:MAG: ABC transporter substrate-binding protein [Firmicutes bacterium]|nr:ABC transporter substrate-binding protein [Bacillota bacterium]
MKRKTVLAVMTVLILCMGLFAGCGQKDSAEAGGPPEIEGLTFDHEMELAYADQFHVYYYNDDYQVITVEGGDSYILIPEGGEVPAGTPEEMVIIEKPVDRIYLAASSAMALFNAMDALDTIAFSGTKADGWYIDAAKEAMDSGKITFAGKYSAPDYEMLLDEGCDLAIESTMITHSPDVKEKIEELGIPVFVDHSSYESHPLGRVEWIRLYGVLTGHEEEADAFFNEQAKVIEEMEGIEDTGKTVAFFFVNSTGQVVVRAGDDYIPHMIDIAGGEYIFPDLINEENEMASMKISMEEFYAGAVDADYLIYNASIESPLTSLDQLYDKSEVFKEFKAVKEGHVYTTDKYLYQATDITGELIRDIHKMLTEDDGEMTFLTKVE